MANFSNNNELDQILFGSLLGDGWLQISKGSLNATFMFAQSTIHEEYFMHVFNIFHKFNLCSANFSLYSQFEPRTNETYKHLRFWTYAGPYFTILYNHWYLNNVKVIPFEFINLLTPLALAHWICQDGTFHIRNGGLYLCTNSFSLEEVKILLDYLTTKYNLKCTIHNQKSSNKTKTYYKILYI
jgi:hypothetical protein